LEREKKPVVPVKKKHRRKRKFAPGTMHTRLVFGTRKRGEKEKPVRKKKSGSKGFYGKYPCGTGNLQKRAKG